VKRETGREDFGKEVERSESSVVVVDVVLGRGRRGTTRSAWIPLLRFEELTMSTVGFLRIASAIA